MKNKRKKDKAQAALDRCNIAWGIMIAAIGIVLLYGVIKMEIASQRMMDSWSDDPTSQPVEVEQK